MITGAGYIATEFAGMLHGLGSKVIMVLRKDQLLRGFDSSITQVVMSEMKRSGVQFILNNSATEITRQGSKLRIELNNAPAIDDVDEFIFAIGRKPNTKGLNVEKAGVELDSRGFVVTDEYQVTSARNIFAVGDVTGRVALTPVAIAAGRKLSDRIFGGHNGAHLDYENIPSVIFSHPPIGTMGLSEAAARESLAMTSKFTPARLRICTTRSPHELHPL